MSDLTDVSNANVETTGICLPAKVYILIAIVILLITLIVNSIKNSFLSGLIASMSQLCCAVICFLLFIGICSVSPTLAWILIILSILCQIFSTVSSIVGGTSFSFSTSQ